MILHKHSDGSCSKQYEVGDRVIVERTIHGGWFDFGPTRSETCIVKKIDKKSHWIIAKLEIEYSKEWGWADCFPWMIKPHPETLAKATCKDFVDE